VTAFNGDISTVDVFCDHDTAPSGDDRNTAPRTAFDNDA
jgi:hypothetical protein